MTSELSTSKHEYFQPTETFWNDEDAPDSDDKQAEEFDAMQEADYESYDCMQDAPEVVTHQQLERLPDDLMQEDAPCSGPEMPDQQMADTETQMSLPNLDAPSGGGASNLDDNLPSKGHSHKHSDSAKRARVGMTGMPETTKPLPVPLEMVQTLLQSAGDGVSILGDTHYIASKDIWRISTNQTSKSRKCLIKSGITHDGPSVAVLFIKRDKTDFCVKYQCTSRQCVNCPNPTIGYVSLDMDTILWKIKLVDPVTYQIPVKSEAPGSGVAVAVNNRRNVPRDDDNPAMNTYEMVKERFENQKGRERFYVEKPNGFFVERDGDDNPPSIYCFVAFKQHCCRWTYWGLNKKNELTKIQFIDRWIRDMTRKTYDRMTIDPTGLKPNVYNLWKGYLTAGMAKLDPAFVLQEIQLFLRHIRDGWCSSNEDELNWILEVFANILQRPESKAEVAILLFGEEGCGKGMILEFLRSKVFGKHCTAQTGSIMLDVFDRFANKVAGNVLIQVDELGEVHALARHLKNFITADTFRYEKKGKDTIDIPNMATLIFTTNEAETLFISAKDRRYAMFQCAELDKVDRDYIPKFVEYLERPHMPQVVAQYLASVDLSKYTKGINGAPRLTFQKTRPFTKFYNECRKQNLPLLSRFLSALINSQYGTLNTTADGLVEMEAKSFLEEYTKYYETASNDRQHTPTSVGVGREITRFKTIVAHRYAKSMAYRLDYVKLQQELTELNQYDERAFL
jgi:hypothetical protein